MRQFEQVCEVQGLVWFDDRVEGEEVKSSKAHVLEGFDHKNGRSLGQRTVEYPMPLDLCKKLVAAGISCPFQAKVGFEVQASGRGSRLVITSLQPASAKAAA